MWIRLNDYGWIGALNWRLLASAAQFQNPALAAECVAYRRRNGPDPSRAAHILMRDQPKCAARGRFIRPDTNEIWRRVTKKTREFGYSYPIRGGLKLDNGVVAAKCDARAFQGFAHEKWAGSGWCTRKGDDIASG